ncbi:MAG: hypothetical protein GX562_05115 [Coriobacteriaceae bacterium]|nr:hypothetical protein [Coriobacteriaceae bacterium]
MKTLVIRQKRLIIALGCALMMLVALPTIAFAAVPSTNAAQIVAELTGRDVDSIIDERVNAGKAYGTIADEAGVLEQFKNRVLELRQEAIAARVAAGTMTQEQANNRLELLQQRRDLCDGTAAGYMAAERGTGLGLGAGAGDCTGLANGAVAGTGNGSGAGTGGGFGATDNPTPGTCTGTGLGTGTPGGQGNGNAARGR